MKRVYITISKSCKFCDKLFRYVCRILCEKTFDDIKDHWSRKYVDIMASRGIIKGLPNNLFGYQYDITRADYVTLLIRMLGISTTVETNFDDVTTDDYFYHTVGMAKRQVLLKRTGIFSGQGIPSREKR